MRIDRELLKISQDLRLAGRETEADEMLGASERVAQWYQANAQGVGRSDLGLSQNPMHTGLGEDMGLPVPSFYRLTTGPSRGIAFPVRQPNETLQAYRARLLKFMRETLPAHMQGADRQMLERLRGWLRTIRLNPQTSQQYDAQVSQQAAAADAQAAQKEQQLLEHQRNQWHQNQAPAPPKK